MDEEIIPQEFLLNPVLFESLFFNSGVLPSLSTLAIEGELGTIRNRFIVWRVFLGIFPEQGPVDLWVSIAKESREEYKALVNSQIVNFI